MENWKWTSLVWVSKPVVLHIEEEAMSLSTNLCVVCHYFCCLRALSQGHVPCWNLPWQGRSLICHDDCKEVANIIFYWKVQALIHCVFDLQIILGKGNASLENETVKHLNIQPDHKVLEIGFGPGIGLNAALEKVEHSSGKVYGIDISEQIVSIELKWTVYWGETGETRGGYKRSGYKIRVIPLSIYFFDIKICIQ